MIAEVSGDMRSGSQVKVQVSDVDLLWVYSASEREKSFKREYVTFIKNTSSPE